MGNSLDNIKNHPLPTDLATVMRSPENQLEGAQSGWLPKRGLPLHMT
jgi:hypothetical protein